MTRLITPSKTKLIPRIAQLGGRVRHLEVNGPPPASVAPVSLPPARLQQYATTACPAGAITPATLGGGGATVPATGVYQASLQSVIRPTLLANSFTQAPMFLVFARVTVAGGSASFGHDCVYGEPIAGASMLIQLGTFVPLLFNGNAGDVVLLSVRNDETFSVDLLSAILSFVQIG